ncbi:hypothetical protein GCM10010468_44530 [Actinocorallia longicatena]|uniref:Helix-turn-helix domain-containing protein n=1 Tax=Actinocorallia longicatena TaxID=111803 RepID=A0ABP6QCM4_9ACTN
MTRAELMAGYGLGRSTLEKWYRERALTGHPEPDGSRGRELTWDAAAWHAWYSSREEGAPAGLASRDRLAELSGLSRHALKSLWADRESNGHPEPAERRGKALYWDPDAWTAWHASLAAPAEKDLLTLAEAGRLLGLAPSSVTVYASRPPKGWPEPVGEVALGGGRVRRLYRRADVLAYAASRG